MPAKILKMNGEDISPAPNSIEEDVIWEIIEKVQENKPIEEITQLLQRKYKIERI